MCTLHAGKGIDLLKKTSEQSAATISQQGQPAIPRDILLGAIQEALALQNSSVSFSDVLRCAASRPCQLSAHRDLPRYLSAVSECCRSLCGSPALNKLLDADAKFLHKQAQACMVSDMGTIPASLSNSEGCAPCSRCPCMKIHCTEQQIYL